MPHQTATAPRIRLASVSKSFDVGGRREAVLESVDITAGAGEFVSIIGPSGCGKSTLLNIIAGLEQWSERQRQCWPWILQGGGCVRPYPTL
jgi:ABC-type nitrate/sulfonate/bicarbonate transport system ATPase subunit